MCFICWMYMRSYTKLSWWLRCFWEAWEFEGTLELSYDQMYLVLCLQDAKWFLIWLFASAFLGGGVSICFSIVRGTVGCINTDPAKSPQDPAAATQSCPNCCQWPGSQCLWEPKEPSGKLQAPSASLFPPGSLAQHQSWPWHCAVPGGASWDHHTGTLPVHLLDGEIQQCSRAGRQPTA